jgi:hypothetical protein
MMEICSPGALIVGGMCIFSTKCEVLNPTQADAVVTTPIYRQAHFPSLSPCFTKSQYAPCTNSPQPRKDFMAAVIQ